MTRHRLGGLELVDHTFHVPLDHDRPEGETLELFARQVSAVEHAGRDLPWLLFLQGGPGFGSPRPLTRGGWIARAVRDHHVLLLDQRGTGRSTPLCARSVTARGGAREQAAFLGCFRADSIVRDAELVRRRLLGAEHRWKVLGQSFGGFCTVHYLSAHPEGLEAALVTGGLPGLDVHADEVYRRTYPIVRRRCERFFQRYPEDVERIARVARRLSAGDVRLPSGDPLGVRRLQTLGLGLGMSDGLETLHYLFESAFVPGTEELSHAFLRGVENAQSFDTNPIFTVLHEACYAQGSSTRWSAERVRAEFPEFEPTPKRVLLTGEMIYPWFLDEIGALAPMKQAADLLAQREDWPALYDPERLAANTVPLAAAVYHDDMYVPRDLSLETAERIAGCRVWVTSEHDHNGLRAAGEEVLDHLLRLLDED